MHPLKQYLVDHSLTEEQFAALVKRERGGRRKPKKTKSGYISQIVCGYRWPSRAMARAISVATGGSVSEADLLTYAPPSERAA